MIHDTMDNITNKNTEHGTYQYDYDNLYRLTSVDNPTVPSLDDEAFTYDPVGNRLTSADTTGNWSYSQNNELQSYDTVSFVYDDNGNMTQKTDNGVITNYIYNIENRLTEVRDGSDSLIASYYYDPFGRRLWKDVGGTKTHFHYAAEGLIGEYDPVGTEIKTYGYKPNSTWTIDPLFMNEEGNYFFYQNDHLGTPQKITAVNGAVVWAASYITFGTAIIDSSSSIENNLRFPGQVFDSETGLQYNWFRYYDSKTGRYLRPDPIGVTGGINLFAYVHNNPISSFDPWGLRDMIDVYDQYNNNTNSRPKGNFKGVGVDPFSKKHTERNRNNRCPETKPKEKCNGKYFDHQGNEWKPDNVSTSKEYHCYDDGYRTFRGMGKFKGSQCTYKPDGKLVDEGPCMGTYDYSSPTNFCGFLNHMYDDVAPHEKNPYYKPGLTETY